MNSREHPTALWQPLLKSILDRYGKEPSEWEIFRGDSFQVVTDAAKALFLAIHLKAGIKQLGSIDVRLSIGVGPADIDPEKVTHSTGAAFTRSGEGFDRLKKQTMSVYTGNAEFDETMNLILSFALLVMDGWTETVATAIFTTIENPDKSQSAIAELMKKSQSSISEALKRGGYEEVRQMETYYQQKIKSL